MGYGKERSMQILDLSGGWRYRTDEDASYVFAGERFAQEGFILPGSACENGVGRRQEYYDEISKEAVRAPRERYKYVAPLWLQREITVPEAYEGKCLRLFLERVNIASELWIDDMKIDRQIIELSAPHQYHLTGRLSAGTHRLTLKIDNRNLLNIGTMASGYSIDTQGYWNGIIGRMELQCEEILHIEEIQVYPDEKGIDVRIVETSDVCEPHVRKDAVMELRVTDSAGRQAGYGRFPVKLYHSREVSRFRLDMEQIRWWSEFHPDLYTLEAVYTCDGITDRKSVRFGMRTVRSEDKKILFNGRPISLRGTTECAIFPVTGYPAMDADAWKERMECVKRYGLNHMRFHAWCPPESAFAAADAAGVYLAVEMPLWLNHDIDAMEAGDDPVHRQYFLQEAMAISRTYGNHPSFLMFSNGNENMGDFELLEDITTCVRAYDKRRIYTLTSNFDHTVLPCEDYLCAFEACGNHVRIQTCHDRVAEDTGLTYEKAVADTPVPVLSFEVGQYCVYPDVDLIDSYTGNMLPVNLDAIKKHMLKKGVYGRLKEYIRASGDLAVKLYKEDIEAALRTEGMGGFSLLSLSDYTGQSTATVGILDAFYHGKGLIRPEEFRAFAGPVVPLFRAKRIFTNEESLTAELGLYDFGEEKIANPEYEVAIFRGDTLWRSLRTSRPRICVPLTELRESALLTVKLRVGEYENSWRVFVFASATDTDTKGVRYIRTPEELAEIKRTGGCAIVTGACFSNPVKGSFIPVFWSPVHFPSSKPCGAMIDASHPALSGFPTEQYPDYQWKQLLEHSVGAALSAANEVDMDGFCGEVRPIVETVPNFFDNTPASPLFEARAGRASLLFCGFDLEGDYPECRQLRRNLEAYVTSLSAEDA
ncbi:MAG: hypothetical protein NC337_14445 [Roseburia sp.]|nr:hypothetical protein [Roseburia sp.]